MELRTLLCILLICSAGLLFSQGRYITKIGEITFEASVPSFEEVKAKNVNVSALLNAETSEFAALALIQGFRFKVALMEEHFNENYMESSKFPKATFKGTIKDFVFTDLSEEEKIYTIKGTITMHGTNKAFEAPVRISKIDDSVEMNLDFILKPGDFNISIPKVVSSKIAEEVEVSAKFSLKK